jgi:hypothetical protein
MVLDENKSSPMIAGAAFDLYVGQFTTGEVAQVCGVSRPVIDMWGTRGFIEPSRRERPIAGRPASTTKGRRTRTSKGKPLFSARDMFKARLMQVLAAQLGIALSDSVLVARKAEKALIDAARIADSIARSGEWMWATARSVEQGKPLYIYAYATQSEQKWLFDMHIINPGEPPSFGLDVPHLYVPMSAIFITVYTNCKKLLGISDQTTFDL